MATSDWVGRRYGRLVVLRENGLSKPKRRIEVQCDCGQHRWVWPESLSSGNTQSCGCLQRERTSRARRTARADHVRLYSCWYNMLKRCTDQDHPSFKNYGSRGIRVCREWRLFDTFRNWALANGYSDNLTLDRKRTEGNYSPSNCRWATRRQQAHSLRLKGTNKTGFIGVYLPAGRKRYVASVTRDGRSRYLGGFDDPFSAAWVRDVYVKQHYDRYVTLNNLKDRRRQKSRRPFNRRGLFNWKRVLSK